MAGVEVSGAYSLFAMPGHALLWAWIVLLPGFFVTRWIIGGREATSAFVAAASLGFGLVTVPLVAHLILYVTGSWLHLAPLIVPATLINGAGVALWRRTPAPVLRPDGPLLWIGLVFLAVTYFMMTDGAFPVVSVDRWKVIGTTNCIMEALCKYLGIHSHYPSWAGGGDGVFWQDIDEAMTMANLLPSGTHTLLFGAPGLRILRAVLGVLLGLLGWIVWERVGGPRRFAIAGLLLVGANPLVTEIANFDRSVLALAYALLLYVFATGPLRVSPIVLGALAGLTAGMGVRMLPIVYLLPLGLHLCFQKGSRLRDVFFFLGAALPTLAISLYNSLLASWRDYSPLAEGMAQGVPRWRGGFRSVEGFRYELLGWSFESHYALWFPFGDAWSRGPDLPFPMPLFWPMHLYRVLGGPILALALWGFWRFWRESKVSALVLLMWGLPVYVVLSGMAFFEEMAQERLILVGLLPLLVFALKGLASLFVRPRDIVAAGVLSVLLMAGAWGIAQLDAPVDERYYAPEYYLYHGDGETDPRDVTGDIGARKRVVYGSPRLVPDYGQWATPEWEDAVTVPAAQARPPGWHDDWLDYREPDLWSRCYFPAGRRPPETGEGRRSD